MFFACQSLIEQGISVTVTTSPKMGTKIYRVEVYAPDKHQYSLDHAESIIFSQARLFFLRGRVTSDEVEMLCQRLLADGVTETYYIDHTPEIPHIRHTIDVTLLPGVTDPAAENLLRAAHQLGIDGLEDAASGERFLIYDTLAQMALDELTNTVFANPVIQRCTIDAPIGAPFIPAQPPSDEVEIIPLRAVDTDADLERISSERRLSLDLAEMRAIRAYFLAEKRDPTDAELEMLAQTWSEHCVHKTFKAHIIYDGPPPGADAFAVPERQEIDGLLRTYIRAATDSAGKSWVRSAFVDNAGIVKFDGAYDLAFKVETHNRPSALEPFGGANTGVGGVVRDILGVSARPIANTDVLCFGPPDLDPAALPDRTLHPRRIAEGVVAGIEDYGNKMGIPTVNGSIHYHRGYTSNPLVFCGCLGILPHGSHRVGAEPGDLIVVIGGRTGRDGLRGATFSSMEMDSSTVELSGGAVQIGHPINEKQVQEAVLRARDEGLYTAITDCGAGGLSSAVGEMGAELGAEVQLESIPLKYPGLRPWEIWLSEAQERMVLAVSPRNWPRLQAICAGQDVEAVVIGAFVASGRLTLHYAEKPIGDLSMEFLHDGIPQRNMRAVWSPPQVDRSPVYPAHEDFSDTLLSLLSLPGIRSKEDVIRSYDHEVGGGTAVKPLVGVDNHGPADAAVIVPSEIQGMQAVKTQAAAISNGINPAYGALDPYAMAWAAVDEALRNIVAVGADPAQVSILDNFCWGNTSLPDRLGALVRCAQGCYDAAVAYGVPYISGKDSLNNEYLGEDGERHAIPGTLLISALGIVPDVTKTVTLDLKQPGNQLYLIGDTRDELGGSHYHLLHEIEGGVVPQPNHDALANMKTLHLSIRNGLICACHDVSEGGIAVALAEMCVAGRLGAKCDLDVVGPDARMGLFSETSSRFIVEVQADDVTDFESHFADCSIYRIGTVETSGYLSFRAHDDDLLTVSILELEQAWRGVEQVETIDISPAVDVTRKTVPVHTVSTRPGLPRVMILHANGTNRDRDAFLACQLAGGAPEIVHVNQIFAGERKLADYHMLVVPGGFSYGDDLGAGVLWAVDLRDRLGDDLARFIDDGHPVLGICNGFQTLVKAGLLPGLENASQQERPVTLTYNERRRFECRWVYLRPNPYSPCLFTQDMDDPIYVPVAHGEGRVVLRDDDTAAALESGGLVALRYVNADGEVSGYPANPNGSADSIAGICNPAGNVFGLMPHPENHVFQWQHPRYHRGERGLNGLTLFKNGIRFA